MLSIPHMKGINYQSSNSAFSSNFFSSNFFLQLFIFKTIPKSTSLQMNKAKLLKFKGIEHKSLLTRYKSVMWLLIFH